MDCPPTAELLELASGRAAAGVAEHVASCASCGRVVSEAGERARVAAASPTVPDSGQLFSGAEETTLPRGGLRRGAVVGRYLALDLLGAGGMGVVYAAYDPELDRRIALKLVRPEIGVRADAEMQKKRILREAQAMARLNHRSVIHVYDVGTVGEQIFVAMELVDGGTAADWLRARPRSWREVRALFLRAGRGLAAAHAAGVVHRDFKPHNVLVRRDGEVRVTDFGLARVGASTEPDAALSGEAPVGSLTRTGTVMGSPGYMSPEQMAGRPAEASSDLFSFCVALYEALYGELPFAGGKLAEIAQRIEREEVRAPPAGSQVPGWLRKTVLRGLRPRPDQRYGSMNELLAALERDPSRIRALWLSGGAALALGAGLLLTARVHRVRVEARCQKEAGAASAAFEADRREAARRAFLASATPYAQAAFDSVARNFAGWISSWSSMRLEACRAAHVLRTQSEEIYALRSACLDDGLRELSAMAGRFARADAAVVRNAAAASASLPRLAACADERALRDRPPPPADAQQAARAAELHERLAPAQAVFETGPDKEALGLALPIAEEAERLGWPPLRAEAWLLAGKIESSLEDPRSWDALQRAAVAAEASRADDLAARAFVRLTKDYVWEHRFGEAELSVRLATAAVERGGNPPLLRAEVEEALALFDRTRLRFPGAQGHGEAALRLVEQAAPGDLPALLAATTSVARALDQAGKKISAVRQYERSLQIALQVFGPDHPATADAHADLGSALCEAGRCAEAREQAHRAIAVQERVESPSHPTVASYLLQLGIADIPSGQFAEAEASLRRALEIRTRLYGALDRRTEAVVVRMASLLAHRGDARGSLRLIEEQLAALGPAGDAETLGRLHNNAGNTLLGLRDLQGARRHFEAAGEQYARAHYPSGISAAMHNRAEVTLRLGDPAGALLLFRRALEMTPDDLTRREHSLWGMASAQLALGQRADARAALEEALSLQESEGDEALQVAATRFTLARALDGDPARARALALQARDAYRAEPHWAAASLREVEAWLAQAR